MRDAKMLLLMGIVKSDRKVKGSGLVPELKCEHISCHLHIK